MLDVRAEWDNEALVWVATSDDVPGLVTEAPSIEVLVDHLRIIIPELMASSTSPASAPLSLKRLDGQLHANSEKAVAQP